MNAVDEGTKRRAWQDAGRRAAYAAGLAMTAALCACSLESAPLPPSSSQSATIAGTGVVPAAGCSGNCAGIGATSGQGAGGQGASGQPLAGRNGNTAGAASDSGVQPDAQVGSNHVEPPPEEDGASCDQDSQCASGHCAGGLCCETGQCCNSESDCPSTGSGMAFCDEPAQCQGTRGAPVCEDFRCIGDSTAVPDDSACDQSVVADDCGLYLAAHCNGQPDQSAPACPTSCAADDECDEEAHCEGNECVADSDNGAACDDDGDCQSAHCGGGHCCNQGDCCASAEDCPDGYRTEAVCDDRETCQGTRDIAVCMDFVCERQTTDDDSACDDSAPALTCGNAADRYCNGESEQAEPECSLLCISDDACDPEAFCSVLSCNPDLEDGGSCSRNGQCQSGHCQNGHCCESGDCCASKSDCSAAVYGTPATCDNATTCQGHRIDPVCNAQSQCEQGVTSVSDDSGCVGRRAQSCGNYRDVYCSAAPQQSPNQAAFCVYSCSGPEYCDQGRSCTDNQCQ